MIQEKIATYATDHLPSSLPPLFILKNKKWNRIIHMYPAKLFQAIF